MAKQEELQKWGKKKRRKIGQNGDKKAKKGEYGQNGDV